MMVAESMKRWENHQSEDDLRPNLAPFLGERVQMVLCLILDDEAPS
jgi:hypothetical protein